MASLLDIVALKALGIVTITAFGGFFVKIEQGLRRARSQFQNKSHSPALKDGGAFLVCATDVWTTNPV
ncbi:hypothetical protein E4U55_002857 [Claviceps digitariae]|nr:hypothetical protein E4U55_002857 [Claviceps digitariae]